MSDLRRRLAAADPARDLAPRPDLVRDLMEATMSTTPTPTPTPASPSTQTGAGAVTTLDARRGRRQRLALAGVAATAAVAVAAGIWAADRPPAAGPGTEQPAALELTMPGPDMMSSCIQFSREVLAAMPLAFDGTVTSTGDGEVTFRVDRWYRGGDAALVTASYPAGGQGTTVSIDGVDFVTGERYLVTGNEEGGVNFCGYTAVWSPELERDFEAAFAAG